MAATLAPVLRQRFFDANGLPLVGGKLWSYLAGTTTPSATYTDSTASASNANPTILDANGECNVWLGSGNYKFVLMNSLDVVQWTTDNVTGAPVTVLSVAWQKLTVSYTAIQTAATTNTVTILGLPALNELSGLVIKHSAAFVGGAISAIQTQIGLAGDHGKFIDAFDAFQAPADAAFDQAFTQYVGSFSGTTNITMTMISTGANLSALTAGSIDIYYRMLLL